MSGGAAARHRDFSCESDPDQPVDKDLDAISHDDSGKAGGKDDDAPELPAIGQKKRAPPIPRHFVEVNRWSLDDHDEEEIHGFIMEYLATVEEAGGGLEGLVQHVDRNDRFGAFTVRRSWPSHGGFTTNIIVNCPYFKQTGCPCQVKINLSRLL